MSHYITCHNCGEPECMDSDTGVHRRDDGTVCPDPRDAEVEGLRAEVERLTRQRDEAHAVLADAAAAFSAGDMERVRLDLCDRYARTRAATLNRQRAEEVARLRAALDALAKATEFPDHSEGHTGPENCAGCRIEAAVDVARAAIAAKGGAT